MVVKLIHEKKAEAPILFTVDGILNDFKLEHSKKAAFSIAVVDSGRFTVVKLVLPLDLLTI